MVAFKAKAVVIATGGAGRIFPFTTNGAIKTGDGMAIAYRAGVPLKDMEFMQYHPTGLPGTGILITEGCRGEGGILVNKDGYRYLQDYGLGPPDPWPRKKAMELGPRDRLSQAFWHEQQKGRTIQTPHGDVVHLDIRHLGEKKIDERLPLVRELARAMSASIRCTSRSRCGRSCTTRWAASTPTSTRRRRCAGLFAAGECACVSINGANRLGSNSLAEILVFGARAGRRRGGVRLGHAGRRVPRRRATAPRPRTARLTRAVHARGRHARRVVRPAQGDERDHGDRRRHLPQPRRSLAGDLPDARRAARALPTGRAATTAATSSTPI